MKTAVITGATSGIGKALAEKFLQQGFSIAFCARNADSIQELVSEWSARYSNAEILGIRTDLAQPIEREHFCREVLATFPEIDVLVNNAGQFFPGKLMEEPEGHLEQLMAVNVFSVYHLTRAFVPHMRHVQGHIFNVCSVASLKAYENGGSYSISKYALLGFSENLRAELMADNVKVTALIPGATWSKSWAASGLPRERFMKSTDMAEMVWAAYSLSGQAVVEQIVLRPLKGDL